MVLEEHLAKCNGPSCYQCGTSYGLKGNYNEKKTKNASEEHWLVCKYNINRPAERKPAEPTATSHRSTSSTSSSSGGSSSRPAAPAKATPKQCHWCKGKGGSKHDMCGGSGVRMKTTKCLGCDGKGFNTCQKCRGMGVLH